MASEDAVPPNESDKFNLSTEEDDKPKKKRIVCCIHGEPCKKGKEEAARAKEAREKAKEAARAKAQEDEARAKDEVNVEPPNRLARMEEKRMKKTLRAIREGLQAAENEKVMKENSAKRSRKSKKSKKAVKEVRVRSSRKEASRKRKERKSRSKKGDSESITSEQSMEASEKGEKDPEKSQKEEALENITKVALEMKHDSPAKRVFLGFMGWKQAERTLIDSGKRIGLYFKFEKVKNIDVLEETLPRFVIFCPYGSDAFTHYRIVHRVVNDRVEYLVEDGSAEAQTFKSLNAVARHYEKLSDGASLVL